MQDEVLTPNELIQLFKIAPKSLEALLGDPTFPARNINGQWRFLRSAVLAWLGKMVPEKSDHALSPAKAKSLSQSHRDEANQADSLDTADSPEMNLDAAGYQPGEGLKGASKVVQRKTPAKPTNPKLKDPAHFRQLPASEKGDLLADI